MNSSSDTGFGFEGSDLNDSIKGSDAPITELGKSYTERLNGMAGDDVIKGRAGTDFLIGGAGSDALYGGAEGDVLWGAGWRYEKTELKYLSESNGSFATIKAQLKEHLWTTTQYEQHEVYYEYYQSDAEADTNTLYGDDGNDTLVGGEYQDSLFGGADDDTAYGGTGKDTIEGGTGNDTLWGDSHSSIVWREIQNDYMVDPFSTTHNTFLVTQAEITSTDNNAHNDVMCVEKNG